MNRQIIKVAFCIFLGLSILSCKRESSSAEAKTEVADSAKRMVESSVPPAMEEAMMSSSAAVVAKIDSLRKFIRTADLNFKVKNAYQSTHRIEDLTKGFGGFVEESSLNNEVVSTETKAISNDSSVMITEYQIKSNMVVRIPQNNLDTFLRSLTPMVEFINKRVVTAKDIHIELLSTQLDQLRNQQFVEETNESKTNSTNARVATLQAQANADAAKIDRLMMLDKIQFSAVTIEIYQSSQIRYDMVENPDTKRFEPSFGTRLLNSLKTGFIVIEELFLFAVKLWGVVVFGFGIYFLVMFIYRKVKSRKAE